MAEYCSKCAKKYGLHSEVEPELCEGCGKLRQNKSNKLLWVISILAALFILRWLGCWGYSLINRAVRY